MCEENVQLETEDIKFDDPKIVIRTITREVIKETVDEFIENYDEGLRNIRHKSFMVSRCPTFIRLKNFLNTWFEYKMRDFWNKHDARDKAVARLEQKIKALEELLNVEYKEVEEKVPIKEFEIKKQWKYVTKEIKQ